MTSEISNGCPYRGLQPYTESDREYFFGRETDREVIASNLYVAPLTILYGTSGVGKSSVLQAGVLPQLRSDARVVVELFNRWQSDAFEVDLKKQIFDAVCAKTGKSASEVLRDLRNTFEDKREVILEQLPLDDLVTGCATAFRCRMLLIFDQFEEYFLYHNITSGSQGFDAQFARAVNQRQAGVNFMLSMREEELSKLDRFRARIPTLLSNLLRLKNLDVAAAERAIREPLRVYNESNPAHAVAIEDPLVAAIIAEVRPRQFKDGGAGEIQNAKENVASGADDRIETPFLQLVLTRLWEREAAANSNTLRLASFRELGGAVEIARTYLDKMMDQLSDVDRDIAAAVLRFLVTPTGSKIALDPNTLAGFSNSPEPDVQNVLTLLSLGREMRILRKVTVPGQPERYELFHDVLGPAILDWRSRYVHAQELAQAAKQADEERVAAEQELARARAMAELEKQKADAQAQRAASEEQGRLYQARIARRLRVVTVALAALVLLAFATAIVAAREWRAAKRNQQEATKNLTRAVGAEKNALAAYEEAHKWAESEAQYKNQYKAAEVKAENQRQAAVMQAARAEQALRDAETQKGKAVRERKAADAARTLAVTRSNIAFNALTAFRLARTADRKDEAISTFQEARGLYESTNDESDRYAAQDILLNIGEIYVDMGNETEAGRIFQVAIDRAKGNFERAETYNVIGDIYRDATPSFAPPPVPGIPNSSIYQPIDKAIENYHRALDLYGQYNDIFDRAQVLIKLGLVEYNSTNYRPNDEKTQQTRADASAHLTLGRELFRQIDAPRETAYAILQIAHVNRANSGFTPESRAAYVKDLNEALSQYVLANDDKGQISVLKELAPLAAGPSKEEIENARKLFTQLAAAYERLHDDVGEASTLVQEAYSVGWFGTPAESNEFRTHLLAIAAALFERAGQSGASAQILMDVAPGYVAAGKTAEAAAAFKKAADMFEREERRDRQIAALSGLFELYVNNSRPQAELYLIQIEALAQMGDKSVRAIALQTLGSAHLRLGQNDRAAQEFEDSIALVHNFGDANSEGMAMQSIGGYYYYASDLNKSIEWSQRAATVYHSKNLIGEAFALLSVGRAYNRLGQLDLVEKYFKQGIEVFHQPGTSSSYSEGSANFELGQILEAKDPTKAIGYLEESARVFASAARSPIDAARALREISAIYRKAGNMEKANEYEQRANNVNNSPVQMTLPVRN